MLEEWKSEEWRVAKEWHSSTLGVAKEWKSARRVEEWRVESGNTQNQSPLPLPLFCPFHSRIAHLWICRTPQLQAKKNFFYSYSSLSISKYVGQSSKSEKSAISRPPLGIGSQTWGHLKALISDYNHLESQVPSLKTVKLTA